jgi:sulfofructose kinase
MIVVGIGQCSYDYLALVETYPSVDTKNEVLEWHEQPGGPVATALVALSRLGVRCRFHGITGDDSSGDKIKESLLSEGMNVHGLVKREGARSQLAFIAIEKYSAKRTIFWKRPSADPLRAEELGEDFLEGAHFLLLDGLMKDASLFAAEQAGNRNIPVMLDAGRSRPGMLDIAKLSDYVVASRDFANDVGWEVNQEALQQERERLGCKILTVTLGDQGSVTVSKERCLRIPAFRVDAIDSTGAGDVFHGGYLYGLLHGWNLKDTIVFASAFAAMKCTRIGGRTGIRRYEEVKQFLAERGYPY